MARIRVLEDEPAQSAMLTDMLRRNGHTVTAYATGSDFLDAVADGCHDLLMVDWELPDTTGIEVLARLRADLHERAPVLFVTNRDASDDIARALEAGADDYMVKEIDERVLLARVGALLRRASSGQQAAQQEVVSVGPYELDVDRREARHHGEPVEMTSRDFDVALYLFRHLGRLVTRKQLLRDVWEIDADIKTRTVDVHVSRVRKRLGIGPESGLRIRTIYQHGYRLEFSDG